MTIIVLADDNYEETSVGPVEFTIGKSVGITITVGKDEISDGLSKEYDSTPVSTDNLGIEVDGSSAEPTFKWEYWDGEQWIVIDETPTDPGNYGATIFTKRAA